tara:strand:+ start:2239 stop:2559 length:321 start_codon:yes stop_codon:yes gene_type:complete
MLFPIIILIFLLTASGFYFLIEFFIGSSTLYDIFYILTLEGMDLIFYLLNMIPAGILADINIEEVLAKLPREMLQIFNLIGLVEAFQIIVTAYTVRKIIQIGRFIF